MSARQWLSAVALATALAGCTDRGAAPTVGSAATGLPEGADQVMYGITTVLTNRGVRSAELRSDTAHFFDDNSRIELRSVSLTFYTTSGQRNSVLTSREGTYSTRQQQMEARGNVVVVSEDGRRLSTEQLRYDQGRDEISSDSAFVLTEPTRRIEGIGFVSDPDMRNIRVLKLREGSGPIDLADPARPVPAQPAPSSAAPPPVTRP